MIDVTWLPFASVSKSVGSLTDTQLDSSWNASYHTLRTLLGCRNPVRSPNVRLWRGYEIALANYSAHLLQEMLERDFSMTASHILFWGIIEDAPRIDAYEREFKTHSVELPDALLMTSTRKLAELQQLPKWFGWSKFHESHRRAIKSWSEERMTCDDTCLVWPWRQNAGKATTTAASNRRAVKHTSGKTRRSAR
jgi:Pyrimidine dimer DNA glycosylase